ncbi:MAG: carbamoyl-phosphate synthase large subunit [Armatimonadetes bacterium]|nr:carbamoyl-phosphate synthase large subunit [Armatimonadota bacterium]
MSDALVVLGSGPIRIGQGIEFDYSCVHCVWALQAMGHRAILINNNPETVSTDFDTADALFFEPVTLSDVLNVVHQTKAKGVVVQFGGQTAINLSEKLSNAGVPILGTSPESIARAEDRDFFEQLLSQLEIPKPPGRAVRSREEAQIVAQEVGFPVLVRPSFVLGGRAMEIVYDAENLDIFYKQAEDANPGQPVLVDKYVMGLEAEVDVISDGETTLVPGIMEHVERAGVHSGDSMAVYPPSSLSRKVQADMVSYACRLARALEIKGLMNIQFVVEDEQVYVIEVNPRASRTVPYLSKVTGIPMVPLATRALMGQQLSDLGYGSGLWCLADQMPSRPAWENPSNKDIGPSRVGIEVSPERYLESSIAQSAIYAVKAPVFSFQKLQRVEPSLGPEMKSTGEVLGIDRTYEAALYKALIASGIGFKPTGYVVLTVNNQDKLKAVGIAQKLKAAGYSLAATTGTHEALMSAGIENTMVHKIQSGTPNLIDLIGRGEVALMINTPDSGHTTTQEAMMIRRACIETGVACVTNIDTAEALTRSLDYFKDPERAQCLPYHEYFQGVS